MPTVANTRAFTRAMASTGLDFHLELVGRQGEVSQIVYGVGKRTCLFCTLVALTYLDGLEVDTTTVSNFLADDKQATSGSVRP